MCKSAKLAAIFEKVATILDFQTFTYYHACAAIINTHTLVFFDIGDLENDQET